MYSLHVLISPGLKHRQTNQITPPELDVKLPLQLMCKSLVISLSRKVEPLLYSPPKNNRDHWLFYNADEVRHGLQHYPMLVPGSVNFVGQCQRHPPRTILLNQDLPPISLCDQVIQQPASRLRAQNFPGCTQPSWQCFKDGQQPDQQEPNCPWWIQSRGHCSSQKFEGRPSTSFSYQFPETRILAEDRGWNACSSRVDRSACTRRRPPRKRQLGSRPSGPSQDVCWCCFRQAQQAAGPSYC